MIQQFLIRSRALAARKGSAVLLAFVLNLAILPCAIAMESLADEHDCCPSSIELQQHDCCEVDAIHSDKRDGDDSKSFVLAAGETIAHVAAHRRSLCRVAVPPDPDVASPPINVLNCVYLK